MRRGRIHVTKELIETAWGQQAIKELSKVFTESAREERPYGIIAIHGYSHMFDECKELESPQYDAIFTGENGVVKFMEFRRV